jgi:type IV secretion system protein VirB9
MFKSFIYSLAITGLTLIPALAEQNPVGQKADVRIKKYFYDEDNVYNLDLYLKTVTAIQLAPDELVQSILIGDSASWEVVKLKSGNVVSIKPIHDAALTNMTIYTDQRVYTFQLRSVGAIKAGAKEGAGQSFRTSFTYPVKDPDKYKVVSGPVNSNYLVSGRGNFRPISVSDNEYQTTFELKPGAQRPAVFKVGFDGKERLINSRTDGNSMIVDGVSDFWVMRIGNDFICVGKAGAISTSKKARKGKAS